MMRGLRAYLVGVLAAISIALVSLKTLPTTIEPAIPAPLAVILHVRMPTGIKLWSAIVDASPKRHTEPHIDGQKNGRSPKQ